MMNKEENENMEFENGYGWGSADGCGTKNGQGSENKYSRGDGEGYIDSGCGSADGCGPINEEGEEYGWGDGSANGGGTRHGSGDGYY